MAEIPRVIKVKPIITIFLVFLILFGIMGFLGKVLIPFIIALIIAYALNPMVELAQRRLHLSRQLIAFVIAISVFVLFLLLPLYLIPAVVDQVKNVVSRLPDIIAMLNNKVFVVLNHKYGTNIKLNYAQLHQVAVKHITSTGTLDMFAPVAKNSFILFEIVVYAVLIPFTLFYCIISWHSIIEYFNVLIPKSYTRHVHTIIKDIDAMLAAYIRGQLGVMLIMSLFYAIGLWFTGINLSVIIGIITGMLVFVPYFGISTGFILAMSACLSNFVGMGQVWGILIVFGLGQLLEGGLVTPYLVGGKIGLNPVMIIMSLMIFAKLFGLVGILLALPLTTIAVVLLKHAKAYYLNSTYYNEVL